MAIITISRGGYSKGKEVAEKVAKRLNYASVSREVIIKASEEFNIPEIKLIRAIHDAPSILERFTFGKERYLAHIESNILQHFKNDNVVYHGLAGHFFVKDISHVLKVRIIADLEDRIKTVVAREGKSREVALDELKHDDHERRQWSLKLYGVDTSDSSLYDLVIHIGKLSVDDAVEIICNAVRLPQFQTTPESQQALDDMALAAKVKSMITDKYPNAKVTADKGMVVVNIKASGTLEESIAVDIECIAAQVSGVKNVKVRLVPSALFE